MLKYTLMSCDKARSYESSEQMDSKNENSPISLIIYKPVQREALISDSASRVTGTMTATVREARRDHSLQSSTDKTYFCSSSFPFHYPSHLNGGLRQTVRSTVCSSLK